VANRLCVEVAAVDGRDHPVHAAADDVLCLVHGHTAVQDGGSPGAEVAALKVGDVGLLAPDLAQMVGPEE